MIFYCEELDEIRACLLDEDYMEFIAGLVMLYPSHYDWHLVGFL